MLFNEEFLETCQFQCFSNFSSTSYLQLNSLLERTVRRLDEDARRTGRISMKEIQEALREIQQSSEFSNFELLTYLFSSMSNSTICPGSNVSLLFFWLMCWDYIIYRYFRRLNTDQFILCCVSLSRSKIVCRSSWNPGQQWCKIYRAYTNLTRRYLTEDFNVIRVGGGPTSLVQTDSRPTLMFNCVSGEVIETRPYGFHPCSILQHVTYGLI